MQHATCNNLQPATCNILQETQHHGKCISNKEPQIVPMSSDLQPSTTMLIPVTRNTQSTSTESGNKEPHIVHASSDLAASAPQGTYTITTVTSAANNRTWCLPHPTLPHHFSLLQQRTHNITANA
jgi:hypothetical protein